jgi:hypothetical protein
MRIPAKIKEVIEQFDYAKVHKVMEYLDWRWDLGDGFEVPTIGEIINRSTDLLLELHEQVEFVEANAVHPDRRTISHSTGGFTAKVVNDNYSLVFAVSEAESYTY